MKKIINQEFKKYCSKDIDLIINDANEYLQTLEAWHLNQCVIYEEERKTICKPIKNLNKEIIGYEISIHKLKENNKIHNLLIYDNYIKSEKIYTTNDKRIKEIMSVSINDNKIIRKLIYEEDEIERKYEETYDTENIDDIIGYYYAPNMNKLMSDLKHQIKKPKKLVKIK